MPLSQQIHKTKFTPPKNKYVAFSCLLYCFRIMEIATSDSNIWKEYLFMLVSKLSNEL